MDYAESNNTSLCYFNFKAVCNGNMFFEMLLINSTLNQRSCLILPSAMSATLCFFNIDITA